MYISISIITVILIDVYKLWNTETALAEKQSFYRYHWFHGPDDPIYFKRKEWDNFLYVTIINIDANLQVTW